MDPCSCKEPTPWVTNRGVETNVCKVCNGKIEPHRTPELGRLQLGLESALLGTLELDPDHPFITWLANCVGEDIRQKKLTWDHNRRVAASVKST